MGNGEPVVKTKSWTQWSLHSTCQDKNLENKAKKKKIISRGNKSKKALWQEDAGTQCYCWLGEGVEELFWEAGI